MEKGSMRAFRLPACAATEILRAPAEGVVPAVSVPLRPKADVATAAIQAAVLSPSHWQARSSGRRGRRSRVRRRHPGPTAHSCDGTSSLSSHLAFHGSLAPFAPSPARYSRGIPPRATVVPFPWRRPSVHHSTWLLFFYPRRGR